MEKGQFEPAMRIARAHGLVLDLGDALDLTLLAATKHKPVFDPMAVRWIWLLHHKDPLSLAEHRWLAEHFQAVGRGENGAVQKIEGFLATGRRL